MLGSLGCMIIDLNIAYLRFMFSNPFWWRVPLNRCIQTCFAFNLAGGERCSVYIESREWFHNFQMGWLPARRHGFERMRYQWGRVWFFDLVWAVNRFVVWSFLFQTGGSVLVQVSMFHEEMSLWYEWLCHKSQHREIHCFRHWSSPPLLRLQLDVYIYYCTNYI